MTLHWSLVKVYLCIFRGVRDSWLVFKMFLLLLEYSSASVYSSGPVWSVKVQYVMVSLLFLFASDNLWMYAIIVLLLFGEDVGDDSVEDVFNIFVGEEKDDLSIQTFFIAFLGEYRAADGEVGSVFVVGERGGSVELDFCWDRLLLFATLVSTSRVMSVRVAEKVADGKLGSVFVVGVDFVLLFATLLFLPFFVWDFLLESAILAQSCCTLSYGGCAEYRQRAFLLFIRIEILLVWLVA